MPEAFEYEERYRVDDPKAAVKAVEAAGFAQTGDETQIDHWFIPKRIMSPQEQAQWFDFESGYALRIREETTLSGTRTLITAKQLLVPGDHSAMTNNEDLLNTENAHRILQLMGEEFADAVQALEAHTVPELTYDEAKQLIESAGRKEYITIDKERRTFANADAPEVVIDIDVIPDLRGKKLGFYAAIEFEYKGTGTVKKAEQAVQKIAKKLGHDPDEKLAKALPGLAIPYLAKF